MTSFATASMAINAMQKNQNARLQIKMATIVARSRSVSVVAWPFSPKYVVSCGNAFAMPIIASDVNAGGPTAMNIAGLPFGAGKPHSIMRWTYMTYMITLTIMPRPCAVRPATIIVIAWIGGWVPAPIDAIVPESIKGKMGRSHAGVMSWIFSAGLEKRR